MRTIDVMGVLIMTDAQQKKAAKEFATYWKDKGYEKGESQAFWLSLLRDVYGIEHPEQFISFEDKVKLDNTSFIDGYIPSTHVMIEQKSLGKDLRKAIKQSDGSMLSPFQQAKRYSAELPYDDRPRWIITCNFGEFLIYDMNKPNSEPEQIFLKDLPKKYYQLQFLVDTANTDFEKEMQLSVDAGKITEKLYKALLSQYQNPDSPDSLKSLNMLCVRFVFCFYADKSGIFKHNQFKHYLRDVPVSKWHRELKDLFRVFDSDEEHRDKYDDESLNAFPYVNGGLFADDNIEIPRFTQEIADIILNEACAFDWQDISPTIFGAIFESTLNPNTRRSGGMHYTSIENIHKVIDPLFLSDLQEELDKIIALKTEDLRKKKLQEYRKKLASLTFLDPACGSGNFLTQTYIELRKLENKALFAESGGQTMFQIDGLIQVSIGQFYGIEINDFAVTVAKTALWIAESKMMKETEEIMNVHLDFLPLKSYANIIEGNSLSINWGSVVSKDKLSYIMGNPPFVGASMMNKEQKQQAVEIFGNIKLSNSIDYVGAWYFKACDLMQETNIKAALVSTNSITQGEQVAPLWGTLFERFPIHIDFAHKTFRWDSEANLKAHVHCVIIGFSLGEIPPVRRIFDNDRFIAAENINAYLVDAPNVFITSRSKPICAVPKMTKGNQPTDGGNFILSETEREELIQKDSSIACCIRRYVGAKDFLNNNEVRYCLWLKDVSPSVYRYNKEIQRRLAAIKEMRANSTAAPTRKFAEKPYLFFSTPQTDANYLIIPRHSSENRRYIPIGFMTPEYIASDACAIICDAELYLFGILMSNVHNAWMRVVAGRLEMRYRYSGSVVYNNFPFPELSDKQKQQIAHTAQSILDARANHPNCSLADLYDELTMPSDLRKAHQQNDFAVMSAYGFPKNITESECVAELMKMYQSLNFR